MGVHNKESRLRIQVLIYGIRKDKPLESDTGVCQL